MPPSNHVTRTEDSDFDTPSWDITPLTARNRLIALAEYLERVVPNIVIW